MNTTSHPLTTFWLVRNRRHATLCAIASVVPDLPYFVALSWGLVTAIPAVAAGLWTHHEIRSTFFAAIGSAWSDPIANFAAQKLLHNLVLSTVFAGVALALRNPKLQAISLGWALHVWVDLSMHVNDAYSVLWPFTRRVFPAPFSYWDPAHHGSELGAVLGAVSAALWVWAARRTWMAGRPRRKWVLLSGVMAVVSMAGLIFGPSDEPRVAGRAWIDDGIDWPHALAPIAAAAAGSPDTALADLASVPESPANGHARPWELHAEAARRALLRGYAHDLAGRRAEAVDAYREAETLEPVGNVGDKARRYQGERFGNVPDPAVSTAWLALFAWGLGLCALQLWRLPRPEASLDRAGHVVTS